jgi:N-acetyl sugar amidotransferase
MKDVIIELTTAKTPGTLQSCVQCVLDTSEPMIQFDEKGVCNYCRQYKEEHRPKLKSEKEKKVEFERLVEKIRASGKGRQYDCIIGLSGGVDSSYVAWLVKNQGLRPLAVHFDNGWNSELAVSNIEQICSRLDIELYTYVVDWEEFRDIQVAFLKAGVANAETPTDHAIFATLYNLAKKFKVQYIVDGVNHATEFVRRNFTASGWVYSDLKHLKAIHKIFGTIPLNTFPTMSFYKKAWLQKMMGIRQVSILNFTDYVKEDALQMLQKELGWRNYGSKHHESTFTKWHQIIYLPKRFGFDKRRMHLSDLILGGQISREQALEELNKPAVSAVELKELEKYVQKKLGLSPLEYQKLLISPPVSYKEYPNDEKVLKLYQQFKK